MKACNIVKSFESGWLVGLSDNNHVLVETPDGDILQPYEGPGGRLYGTSVDNKTITVDEQAGKVVRRLWAKKHEVEERAQAKHDDEIEKLARELTGEDESDPTLEDMGFDDNIRVEDI